MIHTLQNDKLCVQISDFGAELQSIKALSDGCEYLWQGDTKYWDDRAPVLFPVCGRFWGGTYTYRGKEYAMGSHGFAAHFPYEVSKKSDTSVTMTLTDNDEIRAMYPFAFSFAITYTLEGQTLRADINILNCGEDVMPAAFGAHPGFNVPFNGKAPFESFRIRFGDRCDPNQMLITPDGFLGGRQFALHLQDNAINLDHELFVSDGIFMSRMADSLVLESDEDTHKVKMTYKNFPYLGIWQEYGKDTPFICIEPWCGLPSYQGEQDDLDRRGDMFRLQPGESKQLCYTIEIC
ncbi:MAG: aldose 1-epimerase family protein [Clostridia bacterium]|nr:aldose 1-epimerase family protein [Clostridia bacterium]